MRLAALACILVMPVDAFTHGWDTVTDMLAMNPHAAGNGRWNDSPYAKKHWKWVAENYKILVLGRFEDFDPMIGGYNCTCPQESSRTQVARILKNFNPKIKLLWYQNEVGDMTCTCCNEAVRLHPEWWMTDDTGNPLLFGPGNCSIDPATKQPAKTCTPFVNFSVPGVGEWWYQQPLREVCGSDASLLVDGIMMDGTDYFNQWNGKVSDSGLQVAFDGKMRALKEGSEMFHALNGGEVWGNPLMSQDGPRHWGPPRPGDKPASSYNRTLQHYDGAFDESFGALDTLVDEYGECITGKPAGPYHNITCSGEWNIEAIRASLYAMRNATMLDKKTLCVHAIPGPAGTPLITVNGTAATRPSPPHNTMAGEILTFSWWGPQKAPAQWMAAPEYTPMDVVNATKQASANMLVQSLAPFLIAAEETSFFGYGWFYDIESGYAPCDDNRTLCLAPDGWYPEFSEPLGPPKGPAVESGTVWTRDFEHAQVFIDLSNRSLCRIDWTPAPVPAAPLPVEKHIICGGNYGWFSDKKPWEHPACPPPTWEPVWELNRSTTPWTPWGPEIAEGNIPGFVDPVNASRWGWVNFDWSDANAIWQDQEPHMDEKVLVEQCKMVKAKGTGTRCMVYRNTELALQWQESSRAAMTATNVEAGWFLRYKTQALCDSAPPCNVAAYHNIANQSAPLIPCNNSAPVSAPNCASCCNFSRAYNEPIGGPWPPTPQNNGTRFGNNALNDGQFFWDFRNPDAQDYFAREVCLAGVSHDDVDGTFTDDPGGYGQEHPAVQAMVQLTNDEIVDLQLGTQKAWSKALALVTKAKKYFPQAYRLTPPFGFNTTAAGVASCTSWMRHQCATLANESTQVYPQATGPLPTARMAVAAFLVSRGPYSYLGGPTIINTGDWADPIFRLHRLDTGVPTGPCTEMSDGAFSRAWSGGHAAIDCTTATATLDFRVLQPQ